VFVLLLFAIDGLIETTNLDLVRASLVLDAAQSREKVLFLSVDIGQSSARRDFTLYDFETSEAKIIRDGRVAVLSNAIVAQRGKFYIESHEQVVVVDEDGGFAGKLRLRSFEGWEDGLTVDHMEHEGDRVVALCSMSGEENQFLVHLDFRARHAEIQPLDLPKNPYYHEPKYSVVPFAGKFLRIEAHTTEIVALDRTLQPVRTLNRARAPREVHNPRTGRTQTVEVLSRPFVVTSTGLSGKYLMTHDAHDDPLERCIPRGFVFALGKPVAYRDEIVIGRYGNDELLWHRPEQLVYARELATGGTKGTTVAEARRRR